MTLTNEERALALGEVMSYLLSVREHYVTLGSTHDVRDALLDQR
jgi:hypothetical protein